MKSTQTKDEIIHNEEAVETTDTASLSDDSSPAKEKKVKKVIKVAKERIVKNGKDSAINFAIKKIFSCVLSALLSFALVLFAQHSFRDRFKDYVKDFILVNIEDFQELVEHVSNIEGMDIEAAATYCEKNNVYQKSKELLKIAVSYSSEDEDITMLHDIFKEVCIDMLDLSVLICAPTFSESSASEDVRTISGMIQDASINMSIRDVDEGDSADSTESTENTASSENSEYHISMIKIKAKLEIFVELSNELCEKHGIDPFI